MTDIRPDTVGLLGFVCPSDEPETKHGDIARAAEESRCRNWLVRWDPPAQGRIVSVDFHGCPLVSIERNMPVQTLS